MPHLNAKDYEVVNSPLSEAQAMVREFHYTHGGSRTGVYSHGLVRKADNALVGHAWWLPPTRVAAESVNKEYWREVLNLTRLIVLPDEPTNACSFLLGRSIRMIWDDYRFRSLVTYADTSQAHTGAIYKATNWTYVGETEPTPRWLDKDGRQVSPKSTISRTKKQMEELGYHIEGYYRKHKYVLHRPEKWKFSRKPKSLLLF